eukprot:628313-Hanusia_phi.AAC.1
MAPVYPDRRYGESDRPIRSTGPGPVATFESGAARRPAGSDTGVTVGPATLSRTTVTGPRTRAQRTPRTAAPSRPPPGWAGCRAYETYDPPRRTAAAGPGPAGRAARRTASPASARKTPGRDYHC